MLCLSDAIGSLDILNQLIKRKEEEEKKSGYKGKVQYLSGKGHGKHMFAVFCNLVMSRKALVNKESSQAKASVVDWSAFIQ